MKKAFFLSIISASIAFGPSIDACTGIKLIAKDGSFVHGRTLEFGVQVDISAALLK